MYEFVMQEKSEHDQQHVSLFLGWILGMWSRSQEISK